MSRQQRSLQQVEPAWTDRWRFPASGKFERKQTPNGVVDVHQFGGSVHVTAWAQSSVHVKGDFSSRCHIDVQPSGDREEVRLSCSHGPPVGDLEIQIPQGASLDMRAAKYLIALTGGLPSGFNKPALINVGISCSSTPRITAWK